MNVLENNRDMDDTAKVTRRLERLLVKLEKIVNDSPIKQFLDLTIDDLSLCKNCLTERSRSLLLRAQSEDEYALLKDLLASNQINEFDIKIDDDRLSHLRIDNSVEMYIKFVNSEGVYESKRLDLVPGSVQTIGRNKQKCSLAVDKYLTLISGIHAEVKINSQNDTFLRDLGSLNGTFVNNKKCQQNQWIQFTANDEITLGAHAPMNGSASLNVINNRNTKYIECPDVSHYSIAVTTALLLLSDSDHESVLKLIEYLLSSCSASNFIVVVNCSILTAGNDHVSELSSYIAELSPMISFFPLYLSPFVPSDGTTMLVPAAQPEYDECINVIRGSSNDQDWLNSISRSIYWITSSLHKLYEETLDAHLENERSMNTNSDDPKLTKVQGAANSFGSDFVSRYDNFIETLKSSLEEGKETFLDEYSPNALRRSVDRELSGLTQIRKRNGNKLIIYLAQHKNEPDTEYLHNHMLDWCHGHLMNWCTSTLDAVLLGKENDSDSLKGLYSEAFQSTEKNVYIANDEKQSTTPNLSFDLSKILQTDVAPPVTSTYILFPNFPGYIWKQLRSQVLASVGIISIIAGLFNFDNVKKEALPIILPLILILMFFTYNSELDQKCEESLGKLKKEVRNYYITYMKIRIDEIRSYLLAEIVQHKELFKGRLATSSNISSHQKSTVDIGSDGLLSADSDHKLTRIDIKKMSRQLDALTQIMEDIHKSNINN